MSPVKPIEEAPRDGTYFLAIDAEGMMEFVNCPEGCHVGKWKEKRGNWFGVASWMAPVSFVSISTLEELLGLNSNLIECVSCEDNQIVLHRGGEWVETMWASCPKQAKDFVKLYKGGKLPSSDAWHEVLAGHGRLWSDYESDQESE